MEQVDIVIRKAVPTDAAEILAVMKLIGEETPYLVMDEQGSDLSEEGMALNLASLYESPNNVLLVALANGKIAGTANVSASYKKRIEHIGEIGISILEAYWGIGLGTLLLEEIIIWAEESTVIKRLELTVQERNKRAIHLYRKIGFVSEATMPRGAKTDEGEFLDVQLMRLLID